jgi:hypothetical protein
MTNTNTSPKTILCLTSYEKGQEFMREAKRQGWKVILLSVTALEHADWPRDSLDECFFMPDLSKVDEVINGVSYLARTRIINRIVALDDYDVWTGAALREHLRVAGMGETTVRYFRDKLAMRLKAQEYGIPIPDFVHVLNYDRIRAFMERVPPPWMLKPRAEASTIGITKIASAEELWPRLDALGDRQSFFVLERYLPGEVFHIDSLVYDRQVIFSEAHQYGRPPLDVFHGGGIPTTRTISRKSVEAQTMRELNRKVIQSFGLLQGATHLEFIKGSDDGQIFFLEAAARVGGANIADLVEHSTGINLWREWARIETATDDDPYQLPHHRQDYGGVIITLARQEHPDTSASTDPEIVYRVVKRHHVGLGVAAKKPERVKALLEDYSRRFNDDFHASLPPFESRPPSTSE